jgi:hypothetical protein
VRVTRLGAGVDSGALCHSASSVSVPLWRPSAFKPGPSGTPKPMPSMPPVTFQLVTAKTRPALVSIGPPLLPGLMEASVCQYSESSTTRAPLTMPRDMENAKSLLAGEPIT